MKRYHFIGIGGIGMSGLARILLEQGVEVSGSDLVKGPVVSELEEKGALVFIGHHEDNLPEGAAVVYSSDIKESNPELVKARQQGCKMLHRSDLLSLLSLQKKSIAISGTHGKTTTSGLLAYTLFKSCEEASFAVGGILQNTKTNSKWGKGECFVYEADESDCSFLKYHPFGAIVTNIDDDHLSNYAGDKKLLIEAFKQFMQQVEDKNYLFYCFDDHLLKGLGINGESYGFGEGADWKILSWKQEGFSLSFDLSHKDKTFQAIELALSGVHNVLNGAAVFGMALSLGCTEETIRKAFKSFRGLGRRCEFKGKAGSVDLFDDYAHHPTEIKTTLEAVKRAIGTRRLIAVFQPHRYTRTKECLGKFGGVFEAASHVIMTDIYGAGEEPIADLSSFDLIPEIKTPLDYVKRKEISSFLSKFVQQEDVVITLGAGDITKVAGEWLALLRE